MMPQDVNWRFWVASVSTILTSLFVGYVHVGSFYLFGIPWMILAIVATVLWATNASLRNKAVATLFAILAIPIGFLLFVWVHDVTLHRGSWF